MPILIKLSEVEMMLRFLYFNKLFRYVLGWV